MCPKGQNRWIEGVLSECRLNLSQRAGKSGEFERLVALDVVEDSRGSRLSAREAEAAMRRALDIRPTYAWAQYFLALVLLERGDRDGALVAMRQEATNHAKQQGLAIA
jgi:hypothetical protein